MPQISAIIIVNSKLQSCWFAESRSLLVLIAVNRFATIEIDNRSWMIGCVACHVTGPVLSTENAACLHWNQRRGHQRIEQNFHAKLIA
jgi:hypothetical protein